MLAFGAMGCAMERVAVIGEGKVGTLVVKKLISVRHVLPLDSGFDENLLKGYKTVLLCTPYHAMIEVAQRAKKMGVSFLFACTEHHETAEALKALGFERCFPYCGLAPGAVNDLAKEGCKKISLLGGKPDTIEMFAGALTHETDNIFKYHPTWNIDGLIAEYTNPVRVRFGGVNMMVEPLSGYRRVKFRYDQEYEAFYTSGGVGPLLDDPEYKNVTHISYSTLREPGHLEQVLKHGVEVLRNLPPNKGREKVRYAANIQGILNGRRIEMSNYELGIGGVANVTAQHMVDCYLKNG